MKTELKTVLREEPLNSDSTTQLRKRSEQTTNKWSMTMNLGDSLCTIHKQMLSWFHNVHTCWSMIWYETLNLICDGGFGFFLYDIFIISSIWAVLWKNLLNLYLFQLMRSVFTLLVCGLKSYILDSLNQASISLTNLCAEVSLFFFMWNGLNLNQLLMSAEIWSSGNSFNCCAVLLGYQSQFFDSCEEFFDI